MNEPAPLARADLRRAPPRTRPGLVLALMSGMTVLNTMDRQLLAVLLDPIKRELGVSDAAMGLLTGTSFALLHVVATIPIAVWADRGVRRSIVALGLGVWSGLTLLTGFARSFSEIFAIRVGVGIGEATGSGPAQSLLADTFPPERRATALAVLVMGGPLGSMVAFAGGGWLGDAYGWRVAFMVFGAPGLALALLIRMTVREPPRGAFDRPAGAPSSRAKDAPVPFAQAIAFLLRIPSMRALVLASGLNAAGLYAVLVWAVPFLGRVHGLETSAAGARLAIAAGLFTALGTLAGGPLADRLAQRDPRWLSWLPALTSALAFPFGLAFAFAPSADLASALLAPAAFFAGIYFGPVFSAVQTLAAPQTRALAAATVTATNTILGLGLAPPLVGFMNDAGAVSYGQEAIRHSLAAMLAVHLGAAGLLVLAARTYRRDLDAKERLLEGRP